MDYSRKHQKIKIWPLVGLAAIRGNNTGAWRIWRLAHHFDCKGSGKVSQPGFYEYISRLGVGDRKRRRWIAAAIRLGLIRQSRDTYFLVGLASAAVILGADQVGRPATIDVENISRPGWRSYIWGAYLVTQENKQISQSKKEELTGISARTQRNCQADMLIIKRQNYANREVKSNHKNGIRDVCELAVFTNQRGKVVQRLPDTLIVPASVSESCPKGRSKKAQKQVNSRSNVERDPSEFYRLFHDTAQGVTNTLRKIAKPQKPLLEIPGEVFELVNVGPQANNWKVHTIPA